MVLISQFAVASCAIAIASKFPVTIHARARHKVFVFFLPRLLRQLHQDSGAMEESSADAGEKDAGAGVGRGAGGEQRKGAFGDFLGLWPHDLDADFAFARLFPRKSIVF